MTKTDEIMALADKSANMAAIGSSKEYMDSQRAIRQAIEALAKDAARYRWWRQLFSDDSLQLTKAMIDAKSPEEIDAAIDKAIEAAQAEQT